MVPARRHRPLAVFVAVFALLFAQVLYSGFSCALSDVDPDLSAGLCQFHCDYSKHTLDVAKPAAQPPAIVPSVLRVALPELVVVSADVMRAAATAPGPAPPLIGITVLRI